MRGSRDYRNRYSDSMCVSQCVGNDKSARLSSGDTIELKTSIEELENSMDRSVKYMDDSLEALVNLKDGLIEALHEFRRSL